MRDEFSQATKDHLAKRVGYLCSNPQCRMATVGPNDDINKSTNLGVAAHITAASAGGPRYEHGINESQRQSTDNGIWLCHTCAHLVDVDITRYSAPLLLAWKAQAEKEAGERLNVQFANKTVLPQFLESSDKEIIKPNGLYEKHFSGQTVRYFLQGQLLHVEHEPAPGIVAYYVLDEQGTVVDIKLPFSLEEYSVEIPDSMVIARTITTLDNGFTREELRMKWGKGATIVRYGNGKLAQVNFVGGSTVDHILKTWTVAPPDKVTNSA